MKGANSFSAPLFFPFFMYQVFFFLPSFGGGGEGRRRSQLFKLLFAPASV